MMILAGFSRPGASFLLPVLLPVANEMRSANAGATVWGPAYCIQYLYSVSPMLGGILLDLADIVGGHSVCWWDRGSARRKM